MSSSGASPLVGAPVAIDEGASVDEIGGAQADAADFADDESKRQIGVAG